MKVKELIEKLKEYYPELMVVLPGYEGGADELEHIMQARVKKREEKWIGSYEGEYDIEYRVGGEGLVELDTNVVYVYGRHDTRPEDWT